MAGHTDRNARGVARGTRGTAQAGEGAHQAGRRDRAAASGSALGPRGEGLPLRDGRRGEVARRAVRRALPATRLPLHVRPELPGRMPDQLVDRRLHRRRRPAPARPRRDVDPRLAGTAREAPGVQAPHGLEHPVGLVLARRLQLRPRLLADRGAVSRGRGADRPSGPGLGRGVPTDRRSTTPARRAPTSPATSPRVRGSARSSETATTSTTRTRRRGAAWSSS